MSWKLEGTYFENCNCTWVCPCSVSSLTAPSTGDRCQVVLVYHVDSGEVDGTDVSGLTFAIVADTPKQMTDGNWNLGLIIDEAASDEQHQKLAGAASGQMGGPPAALGPLIGKVLGVEKAPIDYSNDGLKHRVRIGDDIEIAVEDWVPQGLDRPTKLDGVFHPSGSVITIAKPTSTRIKAFGMEFHNEGRSAFSGPFNWSG